MTKQKKLKNKEALRKASGGYSSTWLVNWAPTNGYYTVGSSSPTTTTGDSSSGSSTYLTTFKL